MAKAVPVTIELSEDLLLALGRLAQVHGSLPSQELLWILHAALLPSPSLPFCTSDEVRAFWPDYFRSNGAASVQLSRLRYGGL